MAMYEHGKFIAGGSTQLYYSLGCQRHLVCRQLLNSLYLPNMAALSVVRRLKQTSIFSDFVLFPRVSSKVCFTSAAKEIVEPSSEVIIPAYIPRGPTDILKALASTVVRDPTAHHYVYHDDPYLIPLSPINRRTYALSKESGRKVARYFLENFPQNFENDEAEPKIPAFNPSVKLTEISVVSLETLKEMVHTFQVQNALQAYNNLKKDNVQIDHEILCELLELLCFYNSSEPSDDTYIGEQWFQLHQGGSEPTKLWNEDGPAQALFDEMELKDARAYQAIIQGLSRHGNHSQALTMYSQMKEKGFQGSTKMYNGLLSIIPFISQDTETRWEKAEEFLQAMVQEELAPDLITFNTLLYLISRMPGWKISRNKSRSILAEMKSVGVEPSLGTFTHFLTIFCRHKGTTSFILYDIMDIVENQTWELKDPNDMSFFTTAMAVCRNYLYDVDMAHRVHRALHSNNNKKFIENAHKGSIYHTNYINLLCEAETTEKLIETYERLVPIDYTPEPHAMEKFVEHITKAEHLKYVPKMWSDILMFQMDNREAVVQPILSAIAKGGQQDDQVLNEQLLTVAWSIFERSELRRQITSTKVLFTWTGDMLGNLLLCCLNGNDLEKSWEVVRYLIKNSQFIVDYPAAEPLLSFCKASMENGDMQRAFTCLGYACDADIPEALTFLKENASKIPKDFVNRYSIVDTSDNE